MADLQWLDSYSGQTLDELLALTDEYRVDSLVVALEQALQQKAARAGGESLSIEETIVLAVEALEREVNNGGYSQFFVNSSCVYTPLIVDALRRIVCPVSANITEHAIQAAGFEGLSAADLMKGLDSYHAEFMRRNRDRFENREASETEALTSAGSSSNGEPRNQEDSDALEKELDTCDGLYYHSGEDIAGQLFEFVRANKHAIQL
jgi:hypothetical protein